MEYFTYILTNKRGNVMYVGVTNDIERRLQEHKAGVHDGFTKRYHVDKLVYFETYGNVDDAIAREKQIKGWTRAKKNELVAASNPTWRDLSQG